MAKVSKYLIAAAFIAIVSIAAPARAEGDLTVQDTAGVVRGSSAVEGTGKVQFSVVDASGAPADGVEITLTNPTTGEVLTATSVGGTATFEHVAPATWSVASSATGVTFTNVAITSTEIIVAGAGISAAAAGATVLAVGGGATAITLGVREARDDDDDDTPELSPAT